MNFHHEQSWEKFSSLLSSRMEAKNAWIKLIDHHERIVSKPYWKKLREFDIEAEQKEIVVWLERLVSDEPMPDFHCSGMDRDIDIG